MKDISILSFIFLMTGVLLLGNIAIWIRMKILRYSRKRMIRGLIVGNTTFLIATIYGILTKIINIK